MGDFCAVICVEEHVFQLDITMDESAGMKITKTGDNVQRDLNSIQVRDSLISLVLLSLDKLKANLFDCRIQIAVEALHNQQNGGLQSITGPIILVNYRAI